jgi:hypothetical protein
MPSAQPIATRAPGAGLRHAARSASHSATTPGGARRGLIDALPGWEDIPGWTLEQQEALREALAAEPQGTAGDPTAEYWARMERVAQRVHGKSAAECARAARAVAAARRGRLEAYYATAFYAESRLGGGGGGDVGT